MLKKFNESVSSTFFALVFALVITSPFVLAGVFSMVISKSTEAENEIIFDYFEGRIISDIVEGNVRNNYDKKVEFGNGDVAYINIYCNGVCEIEEL